MRTIDSSAHTRFESALAAAEPVAALLDLARALTSEGVSQNEMVRFYASKYGEHFADGQIKDNVGWVAGDEVFAQFAFAHGVNATFTSAAKLRETVGHWGIEFYGSKGVARINCDIAPNVFVRRTTPWKTEGRSDTWEPLDPVLLKSPPPHNLGPVGDWLDAVARNREPECSGRNGAWTVEMVMAVYHAALSGKRVPFPLKERSHPLAA